MKKDLIKIVSMFIMLTLCIGLLPNTTTEAETLVPTDKLINKTNKGFFYDKNAENFNVGNLTLTNFILKDSKMYKGKGKVVIGQENWNFEFEVLELNNYGYFEGAVIFTQRDIKRQGMMYIKNDCSIISGIMYDEPDNTIYFTTGDKSANKEKIKDVVTSSKKTLNNTNNTTLDQNSLTSENDINIRAALSDSVIYGHFIGQPSMNSEGNIRYQFRLGIVENWVRVPEVAKFYLTPKQYSSGYGLDCTDVEPKRSTPSFSIGLSYAIGPVSLSYSLNGMPNYAVRRNSGTSYVLQPISSENEAYWNGVSGSGDNKLGIASDYYIHMMGGTSGYNYGFSIYGAFDVMDIYTGTFYELSTSSATGSVKCN